MISMGVQLFGCSAFKAAQEEACSCQDDHAKLETVRQLIPLLYRGTGKSDAEVQAITARAEQNPQKTIFHILQKYNATTIRYQPRDEL
jgi:hypothetical protein